MGTREAEKARETAYDRLDADGLRRVYAALYGLAIADGEFDVRELQVLESYRREFAIATDEAERIENDVDDGAAVRLSGEGPELDMARRAMFDLATADLRLTPEEEALLAGITQASGYRIADLQTALRRRGLTLSADVLADGGCCRNCGQGLPEGFPAPDGD